MIAILAAALYARVTFLAPRESMSAAFEAGYKRHLEWHRAHHDPWSWHGWTIVSGDRIGTFIDATFGHEAADLDAAVAPAEDSADNAGNVLPFARIVTSGIYVEQSPLSSVAEPFATLITIKAAPGKRDRAESALRSVGGGCFRLARGGEDGTFLVIVPAKSIAGTLAVAVPDSDAFASVAIETLRYRPDLTYVPERAP